VCLYVCTGCNETEYVEKRRLNLDREAQLHCHSWTDTLVFDEYSNHVLLFLRSVVSLWKQRLSFPFNACISAGVA
jgi:hypothetical protein